MTARESKRRAPRGTVAALLQSYQAIGPSKSDISTTLMKAHQISGNEMKAIALQKASSDPDAEHSGRAALILNGDVKKVEPGPSWWTEERLGASSGAHFKQLRAARTFTT